MSCETVNINGVEYKRVDSAVEDGLPYVVVRCDKGGNYGGFLLSRACRQECVLVKARMLWRWWGKTILGLAEEGTFAPAKCKFSNEIPEITLCDVISIQKCSEKAMNSLRGVPPWTND